MPKGKASHLQDKSQMQAVEAQADVCRNKAGDKNKNNLPNLPLMCWLVSLAVGYSIAKDFEVLHFLGVLQEQQSWDTSF